MFTELGMLGGGQNSAAPLQRAAMERRWRPNTEAAPNCPRCDSTNTKFCYYNNYSLSQPRYFCKSCRRYWTKGGSLRSVPVGGGCRKNRRGKAAMRVSNHPDPNSTDSTCLSSSDNSTPSTEQGQRDGGSGCSMPSEIDLALVYEKYISQPPDDDHQSIRLDQSQTAFSQINSGGLLPELAGQFAMEFEAEIAQTMPEFDVIPNCNEVSYQWQAFCDNDTTKDLHGSELNERRGEELYGFAGFRRDLGNQDIANPQSIRSSNWQHQGLEVTRAPADDFVFCPVFSQNSSCFADNFQSFESLYHYHI